MSLESNSEASFAFVYRFLHKEYNLSLERELTMLFCCKRELVIISQIVTPFGKFNRITANCSNSLGGFFTSVNYFSKVYTYERCTTFEQPLTTHIYTSVDSTYFFIHAIVFNCTL